MGEIKVRGIRGATTVDENSPQAITEATQELLEVIVLRNGLNPEDICSAFFTLTKDLDAGFPAFAARKLGWNTVPLLCAQELDVPGSLPRCIRVLIHANTNLCQREVKHVYLKGAASLRPDLVER